MTSKKKIIQTLGLAGLLSFAQGCRDVSKDFTYDYKVGDYPARIVNQETRRILIFPDAESGSKLRHQLSAYLCAEDKDKDGRFDNIELYNIAKGSALESFANLEKLESLYATMNDARKKEKK